MTEQRPRLAWVYLGIGLTTLASLLLELSLTRIFSVVFYYHFAFLAISIALFGLGTGGLLSYLISESQRLFATLGWLSALNGPIVALSLAFLLSRKGELTGWQLIPVYFSAAAPFISVRRLNFALKVGDVMSSSP